MKKALVLLFCFFLAIVFGTVGINLYVLACAKPYIYSQLSDLPQRSVVIIPGAKVYKNSVSHVVRDRIDAGVSCVKAGKAPKYLISGDHGRKEYDEVNQMRLCIQNVYGVDKSLVFLDHAGFSTYETMCRARDVFCVKDAIVVTQKFHAARCVYIGRKLGLDIEAYVAPELAPFSPWLHLNWEVREALARVKNFFLVAFNAKPTYLGERIPISGGAEKTWDQ